MQLFDDTFSYILITCSCLYIIEWLIGAKWQEKAKDNLELWWINLEDLSFSETIIIPISIGKNVLDSLYKKTKIALFTFYIKYFLISTLPTLLAVVLISYANYYDIDINMVSYNFGLKLRELTYFSKELFIITTYTLMIIHTALFIVIGLSLILSYIFFLFIPSLYVTIKLLELALKKPSIIVVLMSLLQNKET